MYSGWDAASSVPSPVSRPSSTLKATSPRTRTRTTPRHQHHQYLDTLLRSKCPKDRLEALNLAIRFRDEHTPGELIPNDLLDELLELTEGDKYHCFCCPRAKKARTITPARDHVRKSLGNFPFKCPNERWCVTSRCFLIVLWLNTSFYASQHSSLRQADLNKHIKTCVATGSPQQP